MMEYIRQSLKNMHPLPVLIAFMVTEYGEGTLSDYGRIVRRDPSSLSIGVIRIREEMEKDPGLREQTRG